MPLQNQTSSRKYTFQGTGYRRKNTHTKAQRRQFDIEDREQTGEREIGRSVFFFLPEASHAPEVYPDMRVLRFRIP